MKPLSDQDVSNSAAVMLGGPGNLLCSWRSGLSLLEPEKPSWQDLDARWCCDYQGVGHKRPSTMPEDSLKNRMPYCSKTLKHLKDLHVTNCTSFSAAGPEECLLWNDLQHQGVHGGSTEPVQLPGAIFAEGLRRWQHPHCLRHLPMPGPAEGWAHREGPQVSIALFSFTRRFFRHVPAASCGSYSIGHSCN